MILGLHLITHFKMIFLEKEIKKWCMIFSCTIEFSTFKELFNNQFFSYFKIFRHNIYNINS